MQQGVRQAPTVFLIDASIYIFQAHFSPHVECYDEEGEELSALFGFAQFLLQFLYRVKPTHLAIAFDESLFCGFRHQLCSHYKSNRELPDENLARQLDACLELARLLNIRCFASRVYEADDLIGALAKRCRDETEQVTVQIVSRDKDLGQLLKSETDCLWDYQRNHRRSRADIHGELGVWPEQIPDYLGLVGDSVDRIRGVPGIGPVAARALLQRYYCMERVYAKLDELASLPIRGAKGLAAKLEEHRELAELSRRLATIVCDLEDSPELSDCDLDSLSWAPGASTALSGFLREYGFREREATRTRLLAERLA